MPTETVKATTTAADLKALLEKASPRPWIVRVDNPKRVDFFDAEWRNVASGVRIPDAKLVLSLANHGDCFVDLLDAARALLASRSDAQAETGCERLERAVKALEEI